MTWEKIKLQNCCLSIADGDHQPPPKAENGIPFITISNFTNTNDIDFTNTMFVPDKYYHQLDSKRKAQSGDILYSVVGSFGIPVLIKEKHAFVFQRHIAILRPDKNKIDPAFLFYTMLNSSFYAKADAVAVGSAQRTISLGALRNIEINLPNLSVQQRIVKVLSAYDELIEVNQKQIRLLEEAARRLYREWFVDLRFPGHEDTPITDGIPAGWTSLALSQIFDYTRGKSYSSEELSNTDGICLINLNNVNAWGGYKRGVEKRFTGTYSENHEVKSGDIIMAVTDMTQERRLVGHVALVPVLAEKALISMDLIKITPKEPVTHYFLYSMLRFSSIAEQISQYANGANVLHLRPENIARLKAHIPSKSIMMRFEKIVANYYAKIEPLEKQILLLQEARDRLLPKLMNGEIEV